MGKRIRISQCMIVKNEEKNIRRALSWGKAVVSEQIVVDTGSTDRTVEIAKSMGAFVFHFSWIDDFSAAKNYAIEQAKGDWIAFLDADEYFSEEDAGKLRELLQKMEDEVKPENRPDTVRCAWLHLDENNKVFSSSVQIRIFRNDGNVRYRNRIHESLYNRKTGPSTMYTADKQLAIYHTGYNETVYQETRKAERNIRLLLRELEREPDNYNWLSYLGDAYNVSGRLTEAKEAYERVIDAPIGSVDQDRRVAAFCERMRRIYLENQEDGGKQQDLLLAKFAKLKECCPDMAYWKALWLIRQGKPKDGLMWLEQALEELDFYEGDATLYLAGQLLETYLIAMNVSSALKDAQRVIKYGTLALRLDRYKRIALDKMLSLFLEKKESEQSVYQFLGRLYDFSVLKDKLFVLRSLELIGWETFADWIYQGLSEEEKSWLEQRQTSRFRLSKTEFREKYPQIWCKNETDLSFLEWMQELEAREEHEFLAACKSELDHLNERYPEDFQRFVKCFSQFPFWGSFEPEKGDYETFLRRIRLLRENRESLLWLYSRLADYRSRRTLLAILRNWLKMETQPLDACAENSQVLYDTDILPDMEGKNIWFAKNCGGKLVWDFVKTYGQEYHSVTCFCTGREAAEVVGRNLRGIERLTIAERLIVEELQVKAEEKNGFWESGGRQEEGRTDEMSTDNRVHLLILDGQGGEEALLDYFAGSIARDAPSIIIPAYYGYENLWKLAQKLTSFSDSNRFLYRFFLRYFGAGVFPTDYYLYAVPQTQIHESSESIG